MSSCSLIIMQYNATLCVMYVVIITIRHLGTGHLVSQVEGGDYRKDLASDPPPQDLTYSPPSLHHKQTSKIE